MKHFGAQVRGILDVNSLLQNAVVLLDPHTRDISLDNLVELVIKELSAFSHSASAFELDESFSSSVTELKNLIFADDSHQILRRSIQAYTSKDRTFVDFEHSWICAMLVN